MNQPIQFDLIHTVFRTRSHDNQNQPMHYLLDQITSALGERIATLPKSGKNWGYAGFSIPPPKCPEGKWRQVSQLEPLSVDIEKASLDGVVINLELAWLNDAEIFTWCREVLAPGGHLLFSTFGPDTLYQLRDAWSLVDDFMHVHDFKDLHSLGDQLVGCGFDKPILDADWMGVEYEDVDLLLDDLRKQGFQNVAANRRKSLTGKRRFNQFKAVFLDHSPVQMTFELIYGYARRPALTDGSIRVSPPTPK